MVREKLILALGLRSPQIHFERLPRRQVLVSIISRGVRKEVLRKDGVLYPQCEELIALLRACA